MPRLLLPRRRILLGAALLLLVLLLAGRYLVVLGAPAPAEPVAPLASAAPVSPPGLVVHVVGAVRRPGLYRLSQGRRIADAVVRAGGATRKADLSLINLAAPLADGEQVVVPQRAPAGRGAVAPGQPAPAGPVHLSTATAEELDALPGVGPVTAEKIIEYRNQHGAFASVDELDAIPGIGPARLDQLRELVVP